MVGALLGLSTHFRHRVIAMVMSLGAGALLALASTELASEALAATPQVSVAIVLLAGAASFSFANAALATAKHRKRCGECMPQPSEVAAPGSGVSIAVGTALDGVPEALVLGVTLRSGDPHLVLILAFALSNVPEALSGTAGMRLAQRSSRYVLTLWGGIALGTALATAIAFLLLGSASPNVTALLRAYGAGALIAMAAETMIPEAFHNGPRYSGAIAATGFALLVMLAELAE